MKRTNIAVLKINRHNNYTSIMYPNSTQTNRNQNRATVNPRIKAKGIWVGDFTSGIAPHHHCSNFADHLTQTQWRRWRSRKEKKASREEGSIYSQ